MVIDGAINGQMFLEWIRQHLAKVLKLGDVVIMDNLACPKKVTGVADSIAEANAELLYLPPYSPDFNPIELAFSKFKRLIRSAKQRAVDEHWRERGQVLDRFTESEFRNYFKHAGYRYT